MLNSLEFKNKKTREERLSIIEEHEIQVSEKRSLLLKLLCLNSSDINPEINADIDDWFEEHEFSKRVCRRLRRSYYNALARECLSTIKVDPLMTFGNDSTKIIFNMEKLPFESIGEVKIGNKIYRVRGDLDVDISESKL